MENENKFGHIILVGSPGDVLKTGDFLIEIDGNSLEDWLCLFDEFFNRLKPFIKSDADYLPNIWNFEESLNNPEWLRESTGNGRIYIYISNVDKALPDLDESHLKCEFFGVMASTTNDRIFLLLDKSYRDSLEECLDAHRLCKERLETENTIRHRQILFVERLGDIKLIREEFIVTVEGKCCSTLKTFYDELSIKLNFRKGFGRNLSAISECVSEFTWLNLVNDKVSDYSRYNNLSFIYFKDVREILPNNNYERSAFFDTLNRLCNEGTFITIDKSDMDFVLGEAERYRRTKDEEMRIWRLEEEQKKKATTEKEKAP
jgi:RNAse (barnase) inhibitor barstar